MVEGTELQNKPTGPGGSSGTLMELWAARLSDPGPANPNGPRLLDQGWNMLVHEHTIRMVLKHKTFGLSRPLRQLKENIGSNWYKQCVQGVR